MGAMFPGMQGPCDAKAMRSRFLGLCLTLVLLGVFHRSSTNDRRWGPGFKIDGAKLPHRMLGHCL